jgi:hypothetical protein
MEDLFAGDRINLIFDDISCEPISATVTRTLSDKEEGLGPEIEDYVACWIEISLDGETCPTMNNVVLMTNCRYSLDGRFVTVRKISGSDCT